MSRWFVAERKKKDSELEAGIWIETKKAESQAAMLEGKLTPAGRLVWGPTEADLLAMHVFCSENLWGTALWLPQGSQAPEGTKAPVSVKLSMSWHHPHCFRAAQCSPLLTAVQSGRSWLGRRLSAAYTVSEARPETSTLGSN